METYSLGARADDPIEVDVLQFEGETCIPPTYLDTGGCTQVRRLHSRVLILWTDSRLNREGIRPTWLT